MNETVNLNEMSPEELIAYANEKKSRELTSTFNSASANIITAVLEFETAIGKFEEIIKASSKEALHVLHERGEIRKSNPQSYAINIGDILIARIVSKDATGKYLITRVSNKDKIIHEYRNSL